MPEPDFLRFASDATRVGLAGGALLLVAFASFLGEVRRRKRKRIDAVGCMPWTTLFLLAFFCGVVLLAVAVKGWIGG